MSAPQPATSSAGGRQSAGEAGASSHARRVWAALPALVVSGSVVSLAGAPLVVLGGGVGVRSLLWLGLVVAPLFGALVAQVTAVLLGAEPATFSFGRYLRRGWLAGLLAGGIPAALGSVLLISWRWWRDGARPAGVSLAASGTACTLALLCAIVALPLAQRLPSLRGWPLVLFSLHVVARRPVPVLAVLASVVIMVGAAVQLSASVLVLLPVPLALVSVTAAWQTAAVSPEWQAALADSTADQTSAQ